MKRLLIILLVGIFLIVTVCIHVIGFSYDRFEDSEQRSELAYFVRYDETFYTTKADLDNQYFIDLMPKIYDFFELLPAETVTRFKEEGWKVIISTTKPDYIKKLEETAGYKIGGNTEHNLRLIYLYLNNVAPTYLLSDFIHEFGHYEDWEKGCISQSKEFQKIYENSRNYRPTDSFQFENYHLSNSKEFFASCYKDYFLANDTLKGGASDVYRFVGDVVWRGNNNFVAFYARVFNYS